jgi:hypothetical protein
LEQPHLQLTQVGKKESTLNDFKFNKYKKENPNSKRTLPIAIKSSFLGRTKANK